jgi:hypothetical protein
MPADAQRPPTTLGDARNGPASVSVPPPEPVAASRTELLGGSLATLAAAEGPGNRTESCGSDGGLGAPLTAHQRIEFLLGNERPVPAIPR